MEDSETDRNTTYPAELATLLSAILAALEPCIAIVDGDGNLGVINPSWKKRMQPAVGQESHRGELAVLLAKRFPTTAHASQSHECSEGLKRIIAGDLEHFHTSFGQLEAKEERWYQVDAHRFDHPPGKAILIISDITAQKRAELAFRKSQDQLYQAQKMEALGTLVAGMAHEINNPISLIMFNLPIVRRVWMDVLPVLPQASGEQGGRKFGGYTRAFLATHFHQLIAD
nr:PAS domain-containing protein [Desulfobacterales bacterium]